MRYNDFENIMSVQAYEKVKTQNYLRTEDIANIIATYRERSSKDKYSYLAPLAEVAENDYNLNIPRYVDNFEEEEPIDLGQVAQQLQDLNQAMQSTDATIIDFCKELGIHPPC